MQEGGLITAFLDRLPEQRFNQPILDRSQRDNGLRRP